MNISQGKFRKKLATILIGGTLLSSTFTMGFNTVLGKDVNLIVDGQTREIMTYSATVGSFLKTERIELEDGEVVTPSLDEKITPEMDIIISTPKNYVIREDEEVTRVKSTGKTVEEVLEESEIELDEHDVVTPALESKVSPNQTISIERVQKETFTEEITLPFEKIQNENADMYKGETKIIEQGVEGIQVNTIQNTFVNDELVSIDTINSEIIQEPVTQVEEIGTKETPSSTALEGQSVKKVVTMEATAYDPTAGSKTAMGTRARVGAVAVDPKVIPLGTKLYVESLDGFTSYGYCVAEDTGGAIKGNRIDLFYNSNSEALRFGRRNVRVYVLD